MNIHQFSLHLTMHTFMHPYKVKACFPIECR